MKMMKYQVRESFLFAAIIIIITITIKEPFIHSY